MAQKVLTTFVDDLTGEEIAEGKGGEVSFGYDGATYLIDLSDKSRKEFEKVLTPYLNAARADRSTKRTPGKTKTTKAYNGKTSDAAAVREWAKANGHEVPERGRIPAAIREAYQASQAS